MPDAMVIAVAGAIVIGVGEVVATALTVARARLRKAAPRAAADPAELAELREAVHWLTGDPAELQKSVDFTQRLLAKQPQGGRLGGGS